MATFLYRKGRITATIRKRGPDGKMRGTSKTFGSKEEADQWVADSIQLIQVTSAGNGEYLLPLEVSILPRHNPLHGICGIYFLFCDRECVYVGQSKNVHVRVRDHRMQGPKIKQFDSYSYLPISADKLDAVEAYYIDLLKPKLNNTLNPSIVRSKNRSSKSVAVATKTKSLAAKVLI